ncbi:hypothetical protein JF550_09005 [Microbacterium esteraromaticum]|uniref:Peptidylprolyl isomerase n=1 Tax=Microbacterium esteraromaticum TaxID=57043 RepID=A0A939DVL8_9MICO|nr:hypothetical protein [Microbacterium esteraromaticum]MBN8206095.1 hypothetical protein [Microbacterium esteraromaticum]MBN8416250.1 hypothetical protein [Microbacterium esteraromaticum]
MRKTTAALSALALSALALTGCSAVPGNDAADCDRVSSTGLAASVEVVGTFGTPQVAIDMPVRASEVKYTDLIVGDGPAIAASNQNAIMTRLLVNGDTGEPIHSALSVWSPDSAAAEFPGVEQALECATEGSRVAVAIPAADLPEGLAPQIGLGADASLVAVYDIQYTLLPKAEGDDVFNTTRGIPSVVRAPDGRPGIIVPGSAAPDTVVVETLIDGRGEAVADGTPMFHYTAVDWANRSVVGSSWDGPVMLNAQSLPEEVAQAISEATIGSQVMVIVPDETGDAVTYVVDILGVIPEELAQG